MKIAPSCFSCLLHLEYLVIYLAGTTTRRNLTGRTCIYGFGLDWAEEERDIFSLFPFYIAAFDG